MSKIQVRRGTSSQWTTANTLLSSGEIGFETDTNKFKIGDGTLLWDALEYFINLEDIELLDYLTTSSASTTYLTQASFSSASPNFATDAELASAIVTASAAAVAYADGLTTADVAENTNLYFTNERAVNAGSATYILQTSQQGIINSASAAAVTYLVDSAPATLDTLNELAAALGDDANFASTVSTSLGNKLDSSSASTTYLTQASASTTYQPIVANVSDTEIGYLNGVTSDIQTQIDSKLSASSASTTYLTQASASTTYQPTGSYLITDDINDTVQGYSSTLNDLAGSTLIGDGFVKSNGVGVWSIDSNEYLTTSSASTTYQEIVENVSDTEIGYLNGVTSDIQTQIDSKLSASSASTTYLTQASASTTYQPIGSYLTSESDTLETVAGRGASSTNAITITNATAASSPTTGALIVTGGVGIGEDLYVDNNVYIGGDINITGSISGSLSFINVTDLVVTDPLIYLAEGNPNDMVDIGIFAALNHGSSAYYHAGLIRDASDSGKWKLASQLDDPINNVIDFTSATFDTLVVGSLESTNASATRTNLGLAIGTDVQAYDADLAAIAAGTIDGGTP